MSVFLHISAPPFQAVYHEKFTGTHKSKNRPSGRQRHYSHFSPGRQQKPAFDG
jgi:hypothetical protein